MSNVYELRKIKNITPIGVVYIPAQINQEKDCDCFIITFSINYEDHITKIITKKIDFPDYQDDFIGLLCPSDEQKIYKYNGYFINPNNIKIKIELKDNDFDFDISINKEEQVEYKLRKLFGLE